MPLLLCLMYTIAIACVYCILLLPQVSTVCRCYRKCLLYTVATASVYCIPLLPQVSSVYCCSCKHLLYTVATSSLCLLSIIEGWALCMHFLSDSVLLKLELPESRQFSQSHTFILELNSVTPKPLFCASVPTSNEKKYVMV